MLTDVFFQIANNSPNGRRLVFRLLFEYLALRYRNTTTWTQMNYGYAEGPGPGHTLSLTSDEEHERYCHQLYFRVVNGVHLAGMDLVEVSCGRGGGAAFLHRRLKSRTMTGVDLATRAIAFCRRVHKAPGLTFLQGEAENLPLATGCADALINVEASFCYRDLDRFFLEARRVLRPGGHFFFADMKVPEVMPSLIERLRRAGFDLLRIDDITANVCRSLELDCERRSNAIRTNVPSFLRQVMKDFAATPDSRIARQLINRTMRYYTLTLRKPVSSE